MNSIINFLNGLYTGTCFMATKTDSEKKKVVDKMYEKYKQAFPTVQDITPEEVLERQKEGDRNVVLVDCRKPEEVDVSVLKGKVVTRDELKDLDLKDNNLELVFYCTIGYRSGMAARNFAKENSGFPASSVYNLAGSCLSWIHAGGEMVKKGTDEAVKDIHVYGKAWDLAPEGYKTEMF